MRSSVGVLHVTRPYYYCAVCHQGQAPMDADLGLCAGSVTVGLNRLLACFGAIALLVDVSPTTCRVATEELGTALAEHEARSIEAAFDPRGAAPPTAPADAPTHLYVSVDGVFIEQQTGGKTEMKVGAVYITRSGHSKHHPDTHAVKTDAVSYVADHADPAHRGRALFVEALRWGMAFAALVVVIADGAHWIWELADEHFPNAVQILDWFHAMSYIWAVANAHYGEDTPGATAWAKRQGTRLRDGKVKGVVKTCRAITDTRPAVHAAVADLISYYTYHEQRMDYPRYRAVGLQIGSGAIESGCKRVIAPQHRQPGMAWTIPGATAVAKVRTWFLSGRWSEAVTHQPTPKRTYTRMAV